MVKITVFQNKAAEYTGFDAQDHAGYADQGQDIVCAAVSVLTINCINSIESFTDASFVNDVDEQNGVISFRLEDAPTPQTQLLMQSMVLGLQSMEDNYNEYVDLIIEEV